MAFYIPQSRPRTKSFDPETQRRIAMATKKSKWWSRSREAKRAAEEKSPGGGVIAVRGGDFARAMESKDVKKLRLYCLKLRNDRERFVDELEIRADQIEQLEDNLKTMSNSLRTTTNTAMKQEVEIAELREALALKEKHLAYYKGTAPKSEVSVNLPIHLRHKFNIFLQQLLSYQRTHFGKALSTFVSQIDERGLPKGVTHKLLLQEMIKLGNEMTEDFVSELELRINGAFGGGDKTDSKGKKKPPPTELSALPQSHATTASMPSATGAAIHRPLPSKRRRHGDGHAKTDSDKVVSARIATGVPTDLVRTEARRSRVSMGLGMSKTPTGMSMPHPAAKAYGISHSRTSLAGPHPTTGSPLFGADAPGLQRILSNEELGDGKGGKTLRVSVSLSGKDRKGSVIVLDDSDEDEDEDDEDSKVEAGAEGTDDKKKKKKRVERMSDASMTDSSKDSESESESDESGGGAKDDETAAMMRQMAAMSGGSQSVPVEADEGKFEIIPLKMLTSTSLSDEVEAGDSDERSESSDDDEDGAEQLDLEDKETREMMAQMMQMAQETIGGGGMDAGDGSDGVDQMWTSFMSFKQSMHRPPTAEKVYKVEEDGFGYIALRDMLDVLPSAIAKAVYIEQSKNPTEFVRDVLLQRGCWPIIRFSGDRFAALTISCDFAEAVEGLKQFFGVSGTRRRLTGILDPQHTTGFRLHRVTAVVRNRNEASHDITALNFRVGRLWTPKVKVIHDAIDFWSNLEKPASMLLLGPNTAEKAALMRQIARIISERARTALVDTRCTVGGYGAAPIECGSAVRFYVNSVTTQKSIIDETRSIYPQIVIVDEVLSTEDIEAVTKLQSEGISVIVGTNMHDLKSLLTHPVFCKLLPPQDRLAYKPKSTKHSADDESLHIMSPHLVVLQLNYNASKLHVYKNIPSAVQALRERKEPTCDIKKLTWTQFGGGALRTPAVRGRGMSMGLSMLFGQMAAMSRTTTPKPTPGFSGFDTLEQPTPEVRMDDEISITDFGEDDEEEDDHKM